MSQSIIGCPLSNSGVLEEQLFCVHGFSQFQFDPSHFRYLRVLFVSDFKVDLNQMLFVIYKLQQNCSNETSVNDTSIISYNKNRLSTDHLPTVA